MIAGVGTDIVEISRIKEMLEKSGDSFIERIFTEKERTEAVKRKNSPEYFAGRWAVKEALSKALGCGIGASCEWKNIETLNNGDGKPGTILSGKALEAAARLEVAKVHVSISHEKDYACAFIVLEN
ncbi:MAG: hypothetical protein A2020_13610 [Lentisphaerae bacterium GWF2_45_14]|nr:MAG: hypothetical protein A2020_13610 [Lentisphaerae bacterium GWF2_45_14]